MPVARFLTDRKDTISAALRLACTTIGTCTTLLSPTEKPTKPSLLSASTPKSRFSMKNELASLSENEVVQASDHSFSVFDPTNPMKASSKNRVPNDGRADPVEWLNGDCMVKIMEFVGVLVPGGMDVVPGNGNEFVDLGLNVRHVTVMLRRYSLSRAWRAMIEDILPIIAKRLNVDFDLVHDRQGDIRQFTDWLCRHKFNVQYQLQERVIQKIHL
jgi:hypothetical protein